MNSGFLRRGSNVQGFPGELLVGLNLYEFTSNAPLNVIDPDGLIGVGVIGVGGGEAGIGFGGGVNLSGGAGVFHGSGGWSTGGFVSGGGFIGGPTAPSMAVPCTGQRPFVVGGGAGGGGGLFLTNAGSSGDLGGPFNQWNISLPKIGPIPGLAISKKRGSEYQISARGYFACVQRGQGRSVAVWARFYERRRTQ